MAKRAQKHLNFLLMDSNRAIQRERSHHRAKVNAKIEKLSSMTKIKTNHFIRKLSKVFRSFKMLFDRFGPFELSQDMIALDSFYEPLVWDDP
jgi:hypothetical protein